MLVDDGARAREVLVRTAIDADESVASAIVHAVAAVDNERITDLPALYEAVDPECLAALLDPDRFRGRVTFEYAGYVVRVDSEGAIAVLPIHEDR